MTWCEEFSDAFQKSNEILYECVELSHKIH